MRSEGSRATRHVTLVTAGLLAVLGAFTALSVPATAAGAALVVAQAEGVSAEEAAARVRKRTGGRVLSVRTVSRGGATVHRVKVLLSGGRVKVFEVPASG